MSSFAEATDEPVAGMVADAVTSTPEYDVDLYSDAVLDDPYPHYRALRDLGPAVWLRRNGLWAISRHADVREALFNHTIFSSAEGVAANERTNTVSRGNLLASDPPEHDLLRKLVGAPLTPKAVTELRPVIDAEAERLVERLVARGSFDAVSDLASHLPVTIVSELVGLPEEGRQNMLKWAAATFDQLGGENERTERARPVTQEMRDYCLHVATIDKLKPGSWSARLYEAGQNGTVPAAMCPVLMRDYLGPSLDTTIFATANMIMLFGQNADQWDLLRSEPSLAANAVNEAIRLESPIKGFTRCLTRDHMLGTTMLRRGDRALLLFASANRDERKWPEAEQFDIRRKVSEQVGFGYGIHACAGMHLARLEMQALLQALIPRVRRFTLGEPVAATNNVLRGLRQLPVTIEAT
jgi:cytochrome P450